MTAAVVEPETAPEQEAPDEAASPDGQAPDGQAPDGQAPDGQAPDGQAPGVPLLQQVGPWLGYAGCFVGAGLVSGGLVHHPLDPSRYTRLAVVGAVVFVLATLVTEVLLAAERPPKARLLRLVGTSLLLSLGIGMLSGGIQHFTELPARGALLVPLGVVLSYVAFVLRGAGPRALLGKVGAGVLVLGAVLFVGLGRLAGDAPAAPHDHGSGASAPSGDQAGEHAGEHGPGHSTGGTDHGAGAGLDPGTADLKAQLAELEELQARLAELQAG